MASAQQNTADCLSLNGRSARHALANVSLNIRSTAVFAEGNQNNKQSPSPLKRRFQSMTGDDTAGFTYLKRRKLSADESLGENNNTQLARRVFRDDGNDDCLRFRSVTREDETCIPVPTIREPTPTEANTPSDDCDNPSSSQDRKSFSSLINYDPSSQAQRSDSTSRAELLKMKLKVAMYKVKTNQIDVPLSDLRVEGPGIQPISTARAVEEAVAQLRREAQEVALRDQRRRADRAKAAGSDSLKLLPAPVLRPTAYSSCKIYPAGSHDAQSLPTSPIHGSQLPYSADRFASPRESIEQRSRQYEMETELTSSVVKGRVAEGLLGLKNGL